MTCKSYIIAVSTSSSTSSSYLYEFDIRLTTTISCFFQREELRARFPGVPGDLVNYFLYVAEEVISLPTL